MTFILTIVVALLVAGVAYFISDEIWIAAIAGLIGAGVVFGATLGYSNPRDLTCYVENKDRTTNSEGSSDARVYTRECGVMNVQDMLFGAEFNSADTYAKIQPEHTYRFHVTGIRIGLFSVFPHIRSAQEVAA